jgi:hypothetical protein
MAFVSGVYFDQMFYCPGFRLEGIVEDKIGRFFISGVCMRSRSFLLSWFFFRVISRQPAVYSLSRFADPVVIDSLVFFSGDVSRALSLDTSTRLVHIGYSAYIRSFGIECDVFEGIR